MDYSSFEIPEIPETGLEYLQFKKNQMKDKPTEVGGFLHYLRELVEHT